jgi:hypothetical protein
MTLAEFKAWFNGFTESMEGVPTKKQWERIQARVAEIDDKPVTYPVFIDRYYQPYAPHWQRQIGPVPVWYGTTVSVNDMKTLSGNQCSAQASNDMKAFFNSASAMTDLGRAEYSSLSA